VIHDFDDDQHVMLVKVNEYVAVVVVVGDECKLFVDQFDLNCYQPVVLVHDVFLLSMNYLIFEIVYQN
jgi:hypothetical protein